MINLENAKVGAAAPGATPSAQMLHDCEAKFPPRLSIPRSGVLRVLPTPAAPVVAHVVSEITPSRGLVPIPRKALRARIAEPLPHNHGGGARLAGNSPRSFWVESVVRDGSTAS